MNVMLRRAVWSGRGVFDRPQEMDSAGPEQISDSNGRNSRRRGRSRGGNKGKGEGKKSTKTNQPKECYGPERSGGIRMAETKRKERNVEAVKADDDEVEAR